MLSSGLPLMMYSSAKVLQMFAAARGNNPRNLRAANRNRNTPSNRNTNNDFRLVQAPQVPQVLEWPRLRLRPEVGYQRALVFNPCKQVIRFGVGFIDKEPCGCNGTVEHKGRHARPQSRSAFQSRP